MSPAFPKTSVHALVLCTVLALITGCSVQTVHPLHESGAIVRDDGILGEWVPISSEFGESNVRIVVSLDESGRYRVCEPTEDDSLTGYLVKLGDHRYLELQNSNTIDNSNAGLSTQMNTYLFARVEIREDQLTVSYPKATAIKNAISSGELTGIVGGKTFFDPIVLTSPAEKLRSFFDSNPDAAFEKPELLKRVDSKACNNE